MAPAGAASTTEAKPRARPAAKRAAAAPVELGVLNERLGYFVRRLQVWVFQDFIRRLSRLDLSPAQFSVLVVVGANAGLSQAQLATTLGIERARLVRLLHRLEQRGLIERRPSSADGRRHALMLTRAGDKMLAEATRLAEQHEDGLKQKLGPKRHKTLLEILRAL
jgi:DNA-binding MarR family transcriptional regulator